MTTTTADTAHAPVTAPGSADPGSRPGASGIVDCDVHNAVPGVQALGPYLSDRWRRHFEEFGLRTRAAVPYYVTRARRLAARADAFPPSGGPPGTDLSFMQEQLLDRFAVEGAVLSPIDQLRFGAQPPDYAAALTTAVNDWTLAEWLNQDERLYSGICVPVEDGALAAREIDRLAGHPRFVQVLLNMHTRDPLGHTKYWRIYEAAARHDLPVAVHVGGVGGNSMTGAGWPTYYLEFHVSLATSAQTQIVSLIFSGIFDRWPNLRFVFQEGGFAWAPALGWRMDRAWGLLREEVPQLTRAPSEYLTRHFWYTTQPMEEPPSPDDLVDVLAQAGLGDRLLFSSDYPHWDFDAPDLALPRSVFRGDLRARILGGNARDLYGHANEVGACSQ